MMSNENGWAEYSRLVLKELESELSEEEKNQKLIEWLKQKIKNLDVRTGW